MKVQVIVVVHAFLSFGKSQLIIEQDSEQAPWRVEASGYAGDGFASAARRLR